MSLLPPQVLSVDHLTAYLRAVLDEDPILADVWVRGEVTNFHQSGAGHCYFSLSSDGCQMRCVLFRGNQRGLLLLPNNGDEVLAHGRVSIYESAGQYQLYVDNIAPEGTGIQQLQFEELRTRLQAEGLFAIARKRPLPELPRSIGVVTSAQGAVWHDICTVVSRRYPLTRLVLAPAAVQGTGAPADLVNALEKLQDDSQIDVIIIGRGGGSAEDLACFNDELVARAIYAARVPVVSAVGHETDVSIADLVADVRAATPSAAAELCVPDRDELLRDIRRQTLSARSALKQAVQHARHEFGVVSSALSRCSPELQIANLRQDLDMLEERRKRSTAAYLKDKHAIVRDHVRTARLLDPRDILRRGYALVSDPADDTDGRVATASRARQVGRLRLTFSDGAVDTDVRKEGA